MDEFKPKKKLRRRLVGSRDTRYRRIWVGYGNNVSTEIELPVPGAGLWLRADDDTLSAMTDGDPISTWLDQSGNGNHAVRVTDDTHRPSLQQGELNSKPGVYFSGTGGDPTHQGVRTPAFMAGYTEAEVFCLLRAAVNTPVNADLTGLWDGGDSGLAGHFPYTDDTIYEEWGTGAGGRFSFARPIAINVPTLYNITTKAGEYTIRMNNSVVATRGVNTVGFAPGGFLLGRSYTGFSYAEYIGHLFEVVVFPFACDNAMRNAMVAYFNQANRWNTAF